MPSRVVHVGLSLSPAEDLREAALPLLEAGEVDALEWSLDLGFGGVPDWVEALLSHYGEAGRLVAHGVELSTLTVGQAERRARWMADVRAACARYRFQHLSEHVGIMTAGAIVGGTPLPHPYTRSALSIGHARLAELATATGLPVGLENLAFALGARDVDEQPDFVEALLAPSGGFLLLDLHNLLCQAESFGRDPIELLLRHPLHRVREVHLAGGNHFRASIGGPPLRRDDHERDVPDPCFAMLEVVLERCPDLRFVFLEHADDMLRTPAELDAFRASFRRARALCAGATPTPVAPDARSPAPAHDDGTDAGALDRAQVAFVEALEGAEGPGDLAARLGAAPALEPWRDWIASFDPRSVELGLTLVSRWGEREHAAPPPGTTRAAVLEAPGIVRFRERPRPEPGPGEVLLRVLATGVCGTDVHFLRGALAAPLPLVLGHETVGVVEARGQGVTLPLGARVGVPWAQASCGVCAHCTTGHARQCLRLSTWIERGGGFALHACAVAEACVRIPDAVPSDEAAPLFCAGHTIETALVRANVRAGERVAVLGVGGLGHLAIQLAAARGAEVLAVTSNPSKRRDALALGAADVLVDDGAGADGVALLVRAGGVDAVISTTSDTSEVGAYVEALRPEGRLVVAGLGTAPLAIDSALLTEKAATVLGAQAGGRAELEALLGRAARGEVRAVLERYPLAQLRRALHRLADRRVRYRAVVLGEP